MKPWSATLTAHLFRSLLGASLVLAGCGGQVSVEDRGTTTAQACESPPETDIDSSGAWEQAQCLIASRPESVLVLMKTAPTYGGSLDGLGGWLFHFVGPADPSTRLIVEISPAQVLAYTESYTPCSDAITRFNSLDVAESLVSLLPAGFENNTLFMGRSLCPGHEDLQGLTHASINDVDGTHQYFHALFDELGEAVASCGPCASALADECGCVDE